MNYRELKISGPDMQATMCGCIGPQNGEPLCPCRMRGVRVVNGRYVQTIDLGPAPKAADLVVYGPEGAWTDRDPGDEQP